MARGVPMVRDENDYLNAINEGTFGSFKEMHNGGRIDTSKGMNGS